MLLREDYAVAVRVPWVPPVTSKASEAVARARPPATNVTARVTVPAVSAVVVLLMAPERPSGVIILLTPQVHVLGSEGSRPGDVPHHAIEDVLELAETAVADAR